MKRVITSFGVLVALILASVAVAAQPYQMYLGTVNNVGNWQVKANGSAWVNAAHVVNLADSNGPLSFDDWAIGLSTDGGPNTIISGLPVTWNDNWNGVWYARTSFNLPAWANYAILIVRPIVRHQADSHGRLNFAADDRVILGLNGVFGLQSNSQFIPPTVGWTLCTPAIRIVCLNRLGIQNIVDVGTQNRPYTFADQTETYITDQQAFKFGQKNWIYLTVNNTGTYDASDPSSTWHSNTDLTFVGVNIYVMYGDSSQFPRPRSGM